MFTTANSTLKNHQSCHFVYGKQFDIINSWGFAQNVKTK